MGVRRAWIGIGLAIFLVATAAGYLLARPLAPERLRAEVEHRLSELLRGEVHVARLRLSLGLALRLEGSDVEVWPHPDGPGLHVDRVVADVRPLSHLTGQRRLSRLRLEGARLRVRRSGAGAWSPPPAATFFAKPAAPVPEQARHPDELLRPLIALEGVARFLLTKPLVADTVELRNGRILLLDAGADTPHALAVESVQASLRARRFLGDTRLRVRARLRGEAGAQGSLEVDGSRSRTGELRIAVATTDLELEALAPYVKAVRPQAQLAGRLSGAVVFQALAPGHGRLEVDAVGHAMRSRAPVAPASGQLGPIEASRVELSGALAITPQHVRVDGAHFASDELELQLDGTVERPLHAASRAQLALTLRNVTLAEVRHLIGWLPEIRREEAEAIVAPLEVGHLRLLRTGGTATFSGWQAFLAGRTRELPRGFVVDAELADATVRVGDADRIEGMSGRLWWTGDRIEIRHTRARFNGSPLPELDLSIEGIANLFGADPEARRLTPGAEPLVGLRPFWQALTRGPDDDEAAVPTLRLDIERLDHPMFYWPIADAVALLQPLERGVRIEIPDATWAGVPVRGDAEWIFEPSERVHGRLSAEAPAGRQAAARVDGAWARGRFEVGALHDGPWRQESARGRFRGRGGEIQIRDAEIQLAPSGRLEATASLNLSQAEIVPYELSFAIGDGDVSMLSALVGLPAELASGRADVAGSFAGALEPEASPAGTLSGLLEFEARDGTIRQAVPAVIAIALASEMLNPFRGHEEVRYARMHTLLEFEQGRLRTDGFALEGPDLRAFASGEIDVGREPHPVDLEVVLFLFRPVDSVLEKIPLVNLLLLGPNENLVAAHFELEGPWDDPEARLVPLRSLAQGPGSFVFEAFPALVQRGLRALDSLLGRGDVAEQEQPEPPAATPRES
jgi:hypothetical protein